MNLNEFFEQKFNTQRDQWENALRSELKSEDIEAKTTKRSADGTWPVLSLDAKVAHQLKSVEAWKKAAQTYVKIDGDAERLILEDLDTGVRLFFFEKDFLSDDNWKAVTETLNAFRDVKDVVVVLTGDRKIAHGQCSFKVIDEENIITGRGAAASGGNNIQELASLTSGLIASHAQDEIHLGVFLDSNFFRNIAKVRAARLLATKVLNELGLRKKLFVIGLTSYREWTLYERYSNMLRNDAQVASGLIAGCDYVQSAGYQVLFDLETNHRDPEHAERSRRMARNTSHILALESMLGVVEDASYGSYHLESLTEEYAKEAWTLMQKILPLSEKEVSEFFMKESASVRETRQKNLSTRRHVLTGVNDFPDTKDHLGLAALPVARFFRTGRIFEELRLKMETVKDKPEVYLAIFGDYAALNSRINFVKNYFELLGLKVTDPGHAVTEKDVSLRKEKFLVLVSSDDHYAQMAGIQSSAVEKYIAGKVELPGFKNLFAGQNVHEVLSGIVDRWGKK
jgi:hypothetical protein